MDKVDLKAVHRSLYSPPQGRFVLVDVPRLLFVKVNGQGDPNRAPAYGLALQWLYGVSYALKFAAKVGGQNYVVAPFEALWWADDPTSFVIRDKSAWHLTVMIVQPRCRRFISAAMTTKPRCWRGCTIR